MAATHRTLHRTTMLALSLFFVWSLASCAITDGGIHAGRYTRLTRTITASGLDTIASRNFQAQAGESFVVTYRTEQDQGQLRLMLVRRGSALDRLERVGELKIDAIEGEQQLLIEQPGTYYYELVTIGFTGSFDIETDVLAN